MLELIIMMAMMGIGISAMLSVISTGTYFAKDTEETVKAINLAREWIEWATNWRNTNWLRFSSDRANCWKIQSYDPTCIWLTSSPSQISSWSYVLYSQNGLWYLSSKIKPPNWQTTQWSTYVTRFKVWLDSNGFYTQTWVSTTLCWGTIQKSCQTPFMRDIYINVLSNDKILVQSNVSWKGKRIQTVTLETVLTNWKSKF